MSRMSRVLALVVFAAAFVVVAGLLAAVFGSLGPGEFAVALLVSVPVAIVLTRAARGVLPGVRRGAAG